MFTLTLHGIDVYQIANWFFIYCFLGWVWETLYVSLKEGEYINRGFVNGPVCTIYGFGAVSVYLILKPLEQNLFFLFLGGIAVATILEYLTAVLMETLFHTSWWDYSDRKFNFQGRICLEASVAWGIFTVILFRVLHPAVEKFVNLYPRYAGEIAVCAAFVVYVCDFCYSASAAFHLKDRIPKWEQALEKKHVELMLKVNARMNALELPGGVSLDSMKDRMEDMDFIRGMNKRRQAILEEVSSELKSYKKRLTAKIGHNTKRFFRAYPHLNRGYRLRHEKDKKHKRS